jgi:hypothetical protein
MEHLILKGFSQTNLSDRSVKKLEIFIEYFPVSSKPKNSSYSLPGLKDLTHLISFLNPGVLF